LLRLRATESQDHTRKKIMSLQIKEETLIAVVEKAMQSDPMEYCGEFITKNEKVGDTLTALAVNLAQLSVEDKDDMSSLMAQSTIISSAMFMTYEMAKAEVEAKELEDLFDA
jgi:proteasome lid subunit RPN8/RPN11